MKSGTKNIIFYIVLIVLFGSLMYVIVKKGEHHQKIEVVTTTISAPENLMEGLNMFNKLFVEHVQSPFGILLLQIIVILLFCRIFSGLFMLIRQPTVVGEIVAGIVLGPSILGYFFPRVSEFLFPLSSLGNIELLSQFGLILFMFVIGMELDIDQVRKKLKETILISHASTILPFFLGMLIAYFIYDKYAANQTPFLSFALFIGIAMSITAFPVLARIIQEKGLTKSHLGTISLASAANGDITAWCLLAIVVAIAQTNSMLSAVYNILFSAVYMLAMFLIVRPFLRMVGQIYHNEEVIDKRLVAFIFFVLTVSSFLTETLGLHALFGAFIAGVVMPTDIKFRKIMSEKVEGISLSFFLPLFFVSTGLKTEISLLNTPDLWLLCGIFILVAIFGKVGSATLTARFVGESWKNSLCIGALMNTRGLMELIILNIGYTLNILPPSIFVILVLMTIVTTFMTNPLLALIQFSFHVKNKFAGIKKPEHTEGIFKVLLSFGRAGSGQTLLSVAHQMFAKRENKLEVTALHFTSNTDVNPLQRESLEAVSFGPILKESQKLGIQIQTRYEISNNVGQDITTLSNEGGYDFLLVGAGITWSNLPNDIAANQYWDFKKNRYFKLDAWFLPNELLKDKTRIFIEETNCPVGVFINRDFDRADKILLVLDSEQDLYLLHYAQTLLKTTNGSINILDQTKKSEDTGYENIKKQLSLFFESVPTANHLYENDITASLLNRYDFMLISYITWNAVSEKYKEALQLMPSTLIISK